MNRFCRLFLASLFVVCFFTPDYAFSQTGTGRIKGRVIRADGSGVGGVSVVLNEIGATDITATNGAFFFDDVPEGAYSITLALGENTTTLADVSVTADATTELEPNVDWVAGIAESITVTSASREVERIVEAPAAITSVSEEEIEQKAVKRTASKAS